MAKYGKMIQMTTCNGSTFTLIFCIVSIGWPFVYCKEATTSGANDGHYDITHLLNTILNLTTYDKALRPGYNKSSPTVIIVDLNIRSMGPISETDMTYSMDTYFRQTWKDERLQFKSPSKKLDKLAVSTTILNQMWKPDTFFYNGQGSYLHTTTTPNKLLRLSSNGHILYSMRLTIKASCPMYLHYFPIDEQSCPLQFGSYAYTSDQVVYKWKQKVGGPIETAKDMRLSQFDLVRTPSSTITMKNTSGEYSTLKVHFVLQRHMGYFLIQVYVPCTLIVVLSWVSFWLNREATEDRVSLGILAELTLTTVSIDARDDLPKVPYPTALDWFIIMCYIFVTATLLEYAGVHYFTKTGGGDAIYDGTDLELKEPAEDGDEEEEEDGEVDPAAKLGNGELHHGDSDTFAAFDRQFGFTPEPPKRDTSHENSHVIQRFISNKLCIANERTGKEVKSKSKNPPKENLLFKFWKCLQGSAQYRSVMAQRANKYGVNNASMIDKLSRILFPLFFILLNIIYWISYTKNATL